MDYESDQPDDFESLIYEALKRNNYAYVGEAWTANAHERFPVACHTMVITTLLCAQAYSTKLFFYLWQQIFSFYQRKQFFRHSVDEMFL